MDSSLLNIINLDCSYNQKDIVLKIPSLGISRGSLNFIIGISGIGKSTFIETLGLMNDTALKNEGKVIFDNEVNILNLWANKDGKDLSAFRKEN